MTPATGVMFLIAMRRSAPCLEAERQRRTSILVSADAGRARLVSRVLLRPRCRKSGSVPGWRVPDLPLTGGRLSPEGIRAPLEEGRSSTAGVQPRFGGVQPALEGVNPTFRPLVGVGAQPFGGRGPGAIGARPFSAPRLGTVQPALEGVDPDREPGSPVGQSLNRDAETRMLIERGLFGRFPPTALAPPVGGLRASPSLGGIGSAQSFGGRRSFRPLVGVGARPSGGTGPGAIGAQPFSGRGPQTPSGGVGAGGGRGGS
jgi:hypothetical protein